ncbi:MAG TPA: lipid-A-disaccharide synthase [Gemmatimonadales bacterium]|nr:lipid-A-disaccharide synthase [Gemmatimonadales bacterium]
MRIFVSAGEPSGDLHAAPVVAALRRRLPGVIIDGLGGPAMEAAGAQLRFRMEDYSAFGLAEVVTHVPRHYRLFRQLRREFRRGVYQLLIVIDYPGFHIRLGEAARAAGVPVLYYIAPQLWAWWPGRARRLARAADRLAVILPFEPPFFSALGLPTEFVGHPLIESAPQIASADARRRLGIGEDQRVLAIFPGSRRQEVVRHWPIFRAAAERLLAEGACDQVLVAMTGELECPSPGKLKLVRGEPTLVLAAADAVLAKSGTTTLEAALADTPMVVAYRINSLTHRIFQLVRRVRWFSLVNLVAERAVVPELLQDEVTVDELCRAVRPLLDSNSEAATKQRAALAEVRSRLGTPGAADRVAELAAELLGA